MLLQKLVEVFVVQELNVADTILEVTGINHQLHRLLGRLLAVLSLRKKKE